MDPHNPEIEKGQPGIAQAALFGLCPCCGDRSLFAGYVRFSPSCRFCSLDFNRFDVGDGPAAPLILIVGGLIAVLAIWVQLTFEPAYWIHAVLWAPLATLLTLGGLRIAKAALVASEYCNKSGEGRLK